MPTTLRPKGKVTEIIKNILGSVNSSEDKKKNKKR